MSVARPAFLPTAPRSGRSRASGAKCARQRCGQRRCGAAMCIIRNRARSASRSPRNSGRSTRRRKSRNWGRRRGHWICGCTWMARAWPMPSRVSVWRRGGSRGRPGWMCSRSAARRTACLLARRWFFSTAGSRGTSLFAGSKAASSRRRCASSARRGWVCCAMAPGCATPRTRMTARRSSHAVWARFPEWRCFMRGRRTRFSPRCRRRCATACGRAAGNFTLMSAPTARRG